MINHVITSCSSSSFSSFRDYLQPASKLLTLPCLGLMRLTLFPPHLLLWLTVKKIN